MSNLQLLQLLMVQLPAEVILQVHALHVHKEMVNLGVMVIVNGLMDNVSEQVIQLLKFTNLNFKKLVLVSLKRKKNGGDQTSKIYTIPITPVFDLCVKSDWYFVESCPNSGIF